MFNISQSNPAELLLAIVFVVLAVGILVAAFVIPVVYLISNLRERWPDYERKKRVKIVLELGFAVIVIAVLIWRASAGWNG